MTAQLLRATPDFFRRFKGPRRRNKFGAIAVTDPTTGQHFDSTGEYVYFKELQLRERTGDLSDLTLHPVAIILAKDGTAPAITYKLDYSYRDRHGALLWVDFKPRPLTARDRLVFKLWQHFGPGVLLIVGPRGKVLKQIEGAKE